MTAPPALVIVEQPRPGVRLVRLARPEKLNALTLPLVADLTAAFTEIAGDDTCSAVVLTGDGRAFCAGVDVSQTAERRKEGLDPADKLGRQLQFVGLLEAVRAVEQPVIAAVNGPAVGFGMALAVASDIRILDPSAALHPGAVKIGLTSGEGGLTYLLPRLIGASRAFEILLTGRPVGAEEALAIGLASHLTEPGGSVATALDVAGDITQLSPFGVRMTKSLLWSNLEAPSLHGAMQSEAHTQMLVSMSSDTGEAMTAFLEKRRPSFGRSDRQPGP